MCQDLSSQVSPHSQTSLYNMSFGRTLQMAYLSTDPPTWNVTNMTAQHTCKNIHKLKYNVITLWRRDYTHWHTKHESVFFCFFLRNTDFWYLQLVPSPKKKKKKKRLFEIYNTTIVAVLHDFSKGNAVRFSCHLLLQITSDRIKHTEQNHWFKFNWLFQPVDKFNSKCFTISTC